MESTNTTDRRRHEVISQEELERIRQEAREEVVAEAREREKAKAKAREEALMEEREAQRRRHGLPPASLRAHRGMPQRLACHVACRWRCKRHRPLRSTVAACS